MYKKCDTLFNKYKNDAFEKPDKPKMFTGSPRDLEGLQRTWPCSESLKTFKNSRKSIKSIKKYKKSIKKVYKV